MLNLRAVLAGAALALGGAAVVAAYYVANIASPRFPDFFSRPSNTVLWLAGLGVLCGTMLLVHARVQRSRREVESEARFRDLAELSADYFWEQDDQYRFIARIGGAAEANPYPLEQVIGKTRWELPALNMTAQDWARHRADLDARREFRDLVILRPGPNGEVRYIATSGRPVFDAAGRFTGYRGVGRNITAQKIAEESLRASEARLRLANQRLEQALDGSSVVLWDADLRAGQVSLSDAWSALVGGAAGETTMTVDALMALVHPEDLELARRLSLEAMKGERAAYSVEHRVRTTSGEWKWILSRGQVAERDERTGRALRMVGTNVDITERKASEDQARQLASFDSLTGCANRMLFEDRLSGALARAARQGRDVALLYMDIDRFKSINDSLGHGAGDAVLREFAARLRGCVRDTDTVARLGGDEFVVLLDDVKGADNARRVADKILHSTVDPMRADDGHKTVVTTSIGVAVRGEETDVQALMKRADRALYEAKSAGRNTFRVG